MDATPRLKILFQDEDLLVIDKPSGLLVHRGWGQDRVVAMTLARDQIGRWVYPVHRLDRGTSGALIFALTPEIARLLQAQFQERRIEKRYLAVVRGIPPESGIIDHPVPTSPDGPRAEATTVYKRLATFERYALVEARPQTGRLHQIRRHFKHISHHLIGDVRYGKGEHNRYFRARFNLHRLVLHASYLAFDHPSDGGRVECFAPLPEDLVAPFREMGWGEILTELEGDRATPPQ